MSQIRDILVIFLILLIILFAIILSLFQLNSKVGTAFDEICEQKNGTVTYYSGCNIGECKFEGAVCELPNGTKTQLEEELAKLEVLG